MLEILITKDNHQYYLDLSPDIAINITMENPMVLEDRIPVPFSLSFTIPKTTHNLLVFDLPHRIGSYKEDYKAYSNKNTVIRFNGLNILFGNLKLVKSTSVLELQFLGIDFNEYLKKSLYELDLGKKYFEGSYANVDYDSTFNFSHSYIEWGNELASGSRGDMVVAPIAILSENQPLSRFGYQYESVSRPGNKTYKIPVYSQDREFINFYNPSNQSIVLDGSTPTVAISKSASPIFPAFRICFLFEVIFGNMLLNNPFEFDHLYDLVLPTFYFPQWRTIVPEDIEEGSIRHVPPMVSNPRPDRESSYPSQPYVELKDFLPNVGCNDFFKSLLNLFSLTLIPYQGKFKIIENNTILSSSVQYNWTSKLVDTADLTYQNGKIYEYGYRNKVKTNSTYPDAITVGSIYEMMDYAYTLDDDGFYEQKFIVGKQVFLKSVQHIEIDNVTEEDEVNYTLLESGFEVETIEENDKYDVSSGIEILDQYPSKYFRSIFNNVDPDVALAGWQVPALKDIDRNSRPSNFYLAYVDADMLIKGETVPSDLTYPHLTARSTAANLKNLDWAGTYGLLNQFHLPFKNWVEKDKIALNATFLLSHLDLHNLDISEKVHVDGRNFFIEKLQFTIFHDHISPVVADLIEA